MRFARVLRRDIDAVNNAIDLPWSNGQAEGQINRLKTVKRAQCTAGQARTAEGTYAATAPHKLRKNPATCQSTITYIGGDKGELLYRGYPIEQLALHGDFLEVCY